jgi:hypothetical protein
MIVVEKGADAGRVVCFHVDKRSRCLKIALGTKENAVQDPIIAKVDGRVSNWLLSNSTVRSPPVALRGTITISARPEKHASHFGKTTTMRIMELRTSTRHR